MSEDLQSAAPSDKPIVAPPARWTTQAQRAIVTAFGVAVATLFVFIFVEGTSSVVIFAQRVLAYRPAAETHHTRFDKLLGWVNKPNVYIPDMYGPGIYLRTNARAFRNNHDIHRVVPEGKLRLICSGDSFTLGYGVDNDHVFCERVAVLEPRLEPVNMGQAGYGIDQAFLWYQRDGSAIDHDIHVFAFITDDFWRMQTSRYNGYAKPVLRVRNGTLVTENVPVPETGALAPWLVQVQAAAAGLRTLALAEKIQRRGSARETEGGRALEEQTRDIALKVFTTLAEANRSKNSTLMLVYLPTKWDYADNDGVTDVTRIWLRTEAAKRGFPFVDLVEEFRKLPRDRADEMFISGHWHYTPAGNEWVARALHQRLLSDAGIQRRLNALPQS
ncbi:hypothetical protein BH24GEM2_BH24GEM2_06080 [soil metagenome]